ncbi:MAG: flagellar assembly protein FliH [Bdellovibrionales bacterium]|nr:flagellar assembly protein FliH [Bdellovibrionales bacterium]
MASYVIRDEEREKSGVVQFEPQKIGGTLHKSASDFIQRQQAATGSSFHISRPTAVHSGISQVEEADLDKIIEARVIAELKEVQERAYTEAYQLGLKEGNEDARRAAEASIREEIGTFRAATETLAKMFQRSLEKNESSIVNLVFFLAEQIACAHIKNDPDAIVNVLNQFRSSEDFEGQIVVRMAPTDHARMLKVLADMGESDQFLKQARLVEAPEVSAGGFLVETQYGQIDATLENRIKKIRLTLDSKKPVPEGETQ